MSLHGFPNISYLLSSISYLNQKGFYEVSDLNFQPLLFGGDINVYSVARAFHEAYGVRSIAYGKYPSFPLPRQRHHRLPGVPGQRERRRLPPQRQGGAEEFPDKTILLLGCGDSYVQLAAHCKDQLPANVVAPYIDGALLDTLINKEKFYQLCDRYGVDHPATFIYDKSMGHDFSLPFGPPYIAKPADSVAYWATGVHAWPRCTSARPGRNCSPPWTRCTRRATPTTWFCRSSSPGTTPICGS